MTKDRYRIDIGTVLEYSSSHNAYICIGKTTQYSKRELGIMRNEQCDDDHDLDFDDFDDEQS